VGLVISGATGRMGRTVARLAAADGRFELLGGIDREGAPGSDEVPLPITAIDASADLLSRADVVVDFSAPPFLRELLGRLSGGIGNAALVTGTTGLETADEAALSSAADARAVLRAANFSVGVNLLIALAERTAAALGTDFDVEIVEAHHRRKEDAPSGTALALGDAVARGHNVDLASVRQDGRSGRPGARPTGEIGFHALRGGDVIGDHHVHFIGERERIELTHRASDRALFAAGSLHAAAWMAGRKTGRYSMTDVLGL
jgi:4-hydroxy-tetrahydrodipicolinate reductase